MTPYQDMSPFGAPRQGPVSTSGDDAWLHWALLDREYQVAAFEAQRFDEADQPEVKRTEEEATEEEPAPA